MGMQDIKRKGRPPKKNYDEEKQMTQLMECVDDCFMQTGEIKATAEELGISSIKVKKLLITSGKLEYEETRQIQRLLAYGKKLSEIQQELGLKKPLLIPIFHIARCHTKRTKSVPMRNGAICIESAGLR